MAGDCALILARPWLNVFLTCHAHTGSDGKTFRRGTGGREFISEVSHKTGLSE